MQQLQRGKEMVAIETHTFCSEKISANQIIECQGCKYTEVVNVLQPSVSRTAAFCWKIWVGCLTVCGWKVMEVELLEVHQDANPTLVAAWEEKNFPRVSELLEKEQCFLSVVGVQGWVLCEIVMWGSPWRVMYWE